MLARRAFRGLTARSFVTLNYLAPASKVAWRPQRVFHPLRQFSDQPDPSELPPSKETSLLLKQIIKQEISEEDEELAQSAEDIDALKNHEVLELFSLKKAEKGVALQELTRSFGDEQILVKFHVQDCDVDEEGQEAMEEEDNEQGEEEVDEHDVDVSYNFTVSITRPGKPTMELACICSGNDTSLGQFDIQSVRLLHGESNSVEGTTYDGPEFGDLVDELQDQLYEFLAQRGVDENVALFVAKYGELRERELYREWLDVLHDTVGDGQ